VFDTVAVDLGGVAARFTPARRLDALAAATGLPTNEITERIFQSGLESRLERGEIGARDDSIAILVDALDHRLDASTLIGAWSQAFEPVGEVLTILAALPERVVLFTNNGPIVELCLEGPLHSIQEVCDDVVCSSRLHAFTPSSRSPSPSRGSPRPWERLLSRCYSSMTAQ
jgi:hypothetical protein